ncbi:MAG: D-alanyl-D-alanine carboxypeptidase/D-alanyl-D-alanine-endopeptidase [Planctomycetes bacterium]|nr:D-alanyl-D-alanine carboxypeptidase/D-alanyl-D-alanine-endopeptidase [Planctomycetota bacterium]
MKKRVFCFIFLIVLQLFLSETLRSAPGGRKLKSEIDTLIYKYKPKGSRVGISIFSINKGKSLYVHNSRKPFVVASNMKIITTATALVYLGSDFVYETKVLYSGAISSGGKLQGDIIIRGSGDPNISGRFYGDDVTAVPRAWAKRVEEQGIKTITGDIVGDDSVFDREFVCESWPEDQHSQWYCAPVSGLSFNDNCINIVVNPNRKSGGAAYVQTEPDTSYVKISNKCKTTDLQSKHLYSLHRRPFTNSIYLKGRIWSKAGPQKSWITIHDPALYMATVFKEILEDRGIDVLGDARVVNGLQKNRKNRLHTLAVTVSSLRQSIDVANKRSQGFYAEQILKTVGAHIKKEGSFSAGADVIGDFLARLGFSKNQFYIDDGSGLSKKNKLWPVMITDLLRYMYNHKDGDILMQSLPISGVDGTLKSRLTQAPYQSRVRAKTGYVLGVCALSGYVETLEGEIVAFSILVNEIRGSVRKAKRLQDAICRLLIEHG